MRRLWAIVFLAACGSESAPALVSNDPSALVQPITAKLEGQRVGPFTTRDASELGANACATGEVDGLELIVCDYGDSDAGMKRLRSAVAGAQSGAVRAYGSRVVAIADRRGVDPRGQSLNRILAALDE